MIIKLVAVEGSLLTIMLAATSALDGTAEKIVLWAAALTGLGWIWANVLRPIAKIVRRTATAVEAFEQLPNWEKRLTAVEERGLRLENGQAAIIRELGIEDQVRRMPPEKFGVPPEDTSHD